MTRYLPLPPLIKNQQKKRVYPMHHKNFSSDCYEQFFFGFKKEWYGTVSVGLLLVSFQCDSVSFLIFFFDKKI